MNEHQSDIDAARAMEIAGWIIRQRRAIITSDEAERLELWLNEKPAHRQLYTTLAEEKALIAAIRQLRSIDTESAIRRVMQKVIAGHPDAADTNEALEPHTIPELTSNQSPTVQKVYHRIHFLRTAWFRYAAAVVLFVGLGWLWLDSKKDNPATEMAAATSSAEEILAPATNRATLTLADGSTIVLDSAGNGQLAMQQGGQVMKKDGEIIYTGSKDGAQATISFNTMSTPRGGQYQLTLADGTKVWLNAASSITFPAIFTGNQRRVTIRGEAYLEVSRDSRKPFYVNVDDRSEVQVLGTRFNIKAYTEEEKISTTLLEGSVRVWLGEQASGGQSLVLRPGQQAAIADHGKATTEMRLVADADIDDVMAWKNGLFNFQDKSLQEVLRELARWYDLEVVYEKSVPNITFGGELGRNEPLANVLLGLEDAKVKFRLEKNRRLVVLQ